MHRLIRAITDRFRHNRAPEIILHVGDITTMEVDAIVNAAKATLMGGSGVDGAIHRAGGSTILDQCRAIRRLVWPDGLPVGEAVTTTGGKLYADHVIHTVGPIYSLTVYRGQQLRRCYTRSLEVAEDLGARTVAFPLISSGVYGWPVDDAISQALSAISAHRGRVRTVTLVLFDNKTYQKALAIYDREGYWA